LPLETVESQLDKLAVAVVGTRPPGPCSPSFKIPVYEISDVHADKTFKFYGTDEIPSYYVNFTVHDTANNYSLACGKVDDRRLARQYYNNAACEYVGGGGFRGDISSQIHLEVRMWNNGDNPLVSLVQYWYCAQENGSYPLLYQAKTEPQISAVCPASGTRDQRYDCSIITPLPIKANTVWTPPALPPVEKRPVPRPSPPTADAGVPDPLRTKDCTAISFTQPDWTLSNATYVQYYKGYNTSQSSLNLTLTSRATGAEVRCSWEGSLRDRTFSGDKGLLVLACSSPADIPFRSNDTFTLTYEWEKRILTVNHDWSCGAVGAAYSTRFTAQKSLVVPWYCIENDGKLCRANTITIAGDLRSPARISQPNIPTAPPPDSISVPGCTAGSGAPTWQIPKFLYNKTTLTEFDRGTANPRGASLRTRLRTMEFELRNTANKYTTSCKLTGADADDPKGKWFRCGDGKATTSLGTPQYQVETWFSFNLTEADGGRLKWNQTWYCSDTDPSTPLRFSGAMSMQTFCGWTNTSISDACSPALPIEPRPPSQRCTHLFSMRWCSVGHYREEVAPAIIYVGQLYTGSLTNTERLPSGNLTGSDTAPGTDLSPGSNDQNSCTINSLGRGPITWTISPNSSADHLFSTSWPSYQDLSSAESILSAKLESSVFPGRTMVLYNIYSRNNKPSDPTLSPYLGAWDPNAVRDVIDAGVSPFVSPQPAAKAHDSFTMRFDASTGYLELSSAWTCKDRDEKTP